MPYTVVVENTKTKTILIEIVLYIKQDRVVYKEAYQRNNALAVSYFHHSE